MPLADPGHRNLPPQEQLLEAGPKSLVPSMGQPRRDLAAEIGQPVAQPRTGKSRWRPAALGEALVKVSKNRLTAAADPGKVTRRTGRDHTPAERTAVTLEQEGIGTAIEIASGETVPPDPPVAAAHTAVRAGPGVVTPQIVNLLEINSNCPYHGSSKWKGVSAPKAKKGG